MSRKETHGRGSGHQLFLEFVEFLGFMGRSKFEVRGWSGL